MKRFLPALAVVLALSAAACTTSPTAVEPTGAPSYDGGQTSPAEDGTEGGNQKGGSIATSGG